MNIEQQPSSVLGELQFLTGPRKGQTFQITKERLGVGRQPDTTNDLLLPEASISRHHALITCEDGIWQIHKLSVNNTLFVDQQEVKESCVIRNHNTIQFGTEVKLLFLSFIPEKTLDPGTAPTVYGSPPPASTGESREKQSSSGHNDPFKNPEHPVWQVIGIFTAFGGVLVEALSDTLQKDAKILLAIVTLLLCAFLLYRARRKPAVSVSQEKLQRKPQAIRAAQFSLWINVALVLTCVLTFASVLPLLGQATSQLPESILSISAILFACGILISFIIFIIQILNLLQKKIFTGTKALARSAIAFGITLGADIVVFWVGTALSSPIISPFLAGCFLGILLFCLESLLMFFVVAAYMLFSRLLSQAYKLRNIQ